MIFVTIGTQAPFDRLIKAIDEIAPFLNQRVVAQTFKSSYDAKNLETYDFLEPNEFNKFFTEADLIVSHAGMGSIISALSNGKPIVIMPRLLKYGEHRNEHQLATAHKFKELGLVYVAMDENELKAITKESVENLEAKGDSLIGEYASASLVESLKDYIYKGK